MGRTFPEICQYVLAGFVASLLLATNATQRALTYLAWTLGFLFMLLDDAFSLHEQFTSFFVAEVSSPLVPGLEAKVYAASVLWGVVGAALLRLLIWGYKQHSESRRLSRRLGTVLFTLTLGGGVLDAVHLIAREMGAGRSLSFALGTLQDGGEILVVNIA